MRAYEVGPRGHLGRAWLYGLAILAMLFLVTPTFVVIPMSFSDSALMQFPPAGWSLRWYAAYAGSGVWLDATRLSLGVATATALIATPLGAAAAWGLHRGRFGLEPLMLFVLTAPLMAPIILIAIGVFYVFARIGLVNTVTGLVLAHTMLAVPFVVTVMLARLRTFDFDQMRAAAVAGAAPFTAFLTIALPQLRVSFMIAALLAFLTSLDEVIVALFISGGGRSTLTKVMFSNLRDQIDPTIAVVSTLLIGISVVAVVILQILQGRSATRAPGS